MDQATEGVHTSSVAIEQMIHDRDLPFIETLDPELAANIRAKRLQAEQDKKEHTRTVQRAYKQGIREAAAAGNVVAQATVNHKKQYMAKYSKKAQAAQVAKREELRKQAITDETAAAKLRETADRINSNQRKRYNSLKAAAAAGDPEAIKKRKQIAEKRAAEHQIKKKKK